MVGDFVTNSDGRLNGPVRFAFIYQHHTTTITKCLVFFVHSESIKI
jgi:hypothetical protein